MTDGAWLGSARGRRHALIVASTDYDDPGLTALRAPAADADALAGVLSDPDIGGFEVRTLLNEPAHVVNEAVEDFFADRSPDDLLLVHFSCHGIKDQEGELYFAMANTKLRLLGATGVAANFVNSRMTRSRSRRIVLLLDCCYAGAFERGMTTRAAKVMDLEDRFTGRGRAVITASGAVEYAFEGGELTESGDPPPSVFTTAMVAGLTSGEADRDQDGYVDLDELYEYVYDAVREATPHQTPGKWTYGVQGDLVIARRSTPVTQPAELPPELQHSIDSPLAGVRTGAVEELVRVLRGRHLGLALAARQALEELAEDDSRAVATAAAAALGDPQAPPAAPPPPTAEAATPPAPPAPPAPVPQGGRRRLLAAGAAAAVVLLVAVAVWWFAIREGHVSTIPASFDGSWHGNGHVGDGSAAEFRAVLGEGLEKGNLDSGYSACYAGPLTVTDATSSKLTMDFESIGDGCNPWTVVFTHTSGGDLRMAVDPSPTEYPETGFEVRLAKED